MIANDPPQPVFKELYISIGDLATTMMPDGNLASNRWLSQHLTQTLDQRMLKLLARADDSDLFSSFSVNLNVSTLLLRDFIEFDSSLRAGSRGTIVIELQPLDIFADYARFMFARDFVREKGYRLCLDGVTDNFIDFIDQQKMGFDLIKLVSSPELAAEGNRARRDQVAVLVKEMGKSRVILSRCDTPAAVRNGQEMGIAMFQGRYIDAMLRKQRSYIPRQNGRRAAGPPRARASCK